MTKRIRVILAVVLVCGCIALAQAKPQRKLTIREVAQEMIAYCGAYESESPEGYLGVPMTMVEKDKLFFIVVDQRIAKDKPDRIVNMVSTIRVTSNATGVNIFRGERTDYKVSTGSCRRYPVAFGFAHPQNQPHCWVSMWHGVNTLPAFRRASASMTAEVTSVARRALMIRHKSSGDQWRVPGEDLVFVQTSSRDKALLAWGLNFRDEMVHTPPRIIRAELSTKARRLALEALTIGGLKSSIVILDFPNLF